MSDLLYQWPAGTKYGGRVPKEKLYQSGHVPGALREAFVADVERITWTYKLAEETINLPGTAAVPEIEIFQIDARRDDITDAILFAVDKAVPNPIIFEVTRDVRQRPEVRMVAAHKHLGLNSVRSPRYYSTKWMPVDTARAPLPTAISLPALYGALLSPLTPIEIRPGEDISEVHTRLEAMARLQREITGLERKIRSEPQLNRKIDLRRVLKAKQAELEEAK